MRRIILGLTCLLGACSVVYVDPPVVFDRPDATVISGDPSLELGIFKEQFFTPLADNGLLPIVAGFQGGNWVMPAIRAVAMQGRVKAMATVRLVSTNEIVGALEDPSARLQPTVLGYSELIALPIPIAHAAPNAMRPIDDIFGQEAIIELKIEDENGRSAVTQLEIILVED